MPRGAAAAAAAHEAAAAALVAAPGGVWARGGKSLCGDVEASGLTPTSPCIGRSSGRGHVASEFLMLPAEPRKTQLASFLVVHRANGGKYLQRGSLAASRHIPLYRRALAKVTTFRDMLFDIQRTDLWREVEQDVRRSFGKHSATEVFGAGALVGATALLLRNKGVPRPLAPPPRGLATFKSRRVASSLPLGRGQQRLRRRCTGSREQVLPLQELHEDGDLEEDEEQDEEAAFDW